MKENILEIDNMKSQQRNSIHRKQPNGNFRSKNTLLEIQMSLVGFNNRMEMTEKIQ